MCKIFEKYAFKLILTDNIIKPYKLKVNKKARINNH